MGVKMNTVDFRLKLRNKIFSSGIRLTALASKLGVQYQNLYNYLRNTTLNEEEEKRLTIYVDKYCIGDKDV